MTLIQPFGSALNLNVHFHLLVLDGVYRRSGEGRLLLVPVPAPSAGELQLFAARRSGGDGLTHESGARSSDDLKFVTHALKATPRSMPVDTGEML